jgi:hypothetical protein
LAAKGAQWAAVPVLVRNHGSFSINISEGGIYLFAAANLSLGMQIEFRPPGSKRIRTYGSVSRRALYPYAIKFLVDDVALLHSRIIAQVHASREAQ